MTRIRPLALCLLVAGCYSGWGDRWSDDDTIVGDDDDTAPDDDDSTEEAGDDRDGDTISDADDGEFDADGDGIANADDLDSDGDGRPDYDEAGDGDVSTPPADSDSDGTPDFLDVDSDDNGIQDAAEDGGDLDGDGTDNASDLDDDGDGIDDSTEIGGSPASPRDTDNDGTPDFVDTDSDGDSVPDAIEGSDDPDGDGIPSYRDFDSDSDGIADQVEALPDPTNPPDSDGDGFYDFEDADSDNDGIEDDIEGQLGTDPTDRDTDGDGFTDMAEVQAGTSPTNAGSTIAGYYAELSPRQPTTLQVPFTPEIEQADVFFLLDATCSMTEELNVMAANFSNVVSQLQAQIPNLAYGVADFQDYALDPYGYWWMGDKPFSLKQQVTTNTSLVQGALSALFVRDGGDFPEASMEALYQATTGVGYDQDGDNQYDTYTDVYPFIASGADAFGGTQPGVNNAGTPGTGNLGGAGFRAGSVPIIVYTTDNYMRDSDQPGSYGLPPSYANPAGQGDVVGAVANLGGKLIAIGTDGTPIPQMTQLANATGSLADINGDGNVEPLVFQGIDSSVVTNVIAGVSAIANSALFDLTLEVDDEPYGFVTDIAPTVVPDAPVGQTVTFSVTIYPSVPQTPVDQVFVFPMQVIGNGTSVLAEWQLVLVVLAGA